MEKDIVISKEYINKIRKFAAIRPDETFNYIPVAFRDMEESMQPIFTVRPVSGEKVLKYSDEMSGEVTSSGGSLNVKVKRGSFNVSVVKEGLVGWENYYDINGKIIPYNKTIDHLPKDLIVELSEAILSRASLSEEEVFGFKIAAFLWSGAAGRNFNCLDCKRDPSRMETWGCTGKTKMATPTMIDEESNMRFWSCPVKFVPSSIWDFLHIRKFYKDHPSSPFPSYRTLSTRYESAEIIFDRYLSEYKGHVK